MTVATCESRSERPRPLASAVFLLDSWLRRRHHVFEFADDWKCLLRLQHTTAEHPLRLSDGTLVAPGDPLLDLHIWNEHVPPMGADGPDLAWARMLGIRVDHSLRLLARHVREHPAEYRYITAIRADMNLGPEARNRRLGRLAARFGFESMPASSSQPGPVRRVGENMLMLLLVLASNPAGARLAVFRRKHTVAYLSRRLLERRYGRPAPGMQADDC